jgi:hypothetical protein
MTDRDGTNMVARNLPVIDPQTSLRVRHVGALTFIP